ncbi:hypothetical protein HJFPF1_04073 [Paramyrothecium foliicola]|nr:hypothetical protein HJFPF1_04073 [Paramyrothecium foliicola]
MTAMRLSRVIVGIALLIAQPNTHVQAACYYPNGDVAQNDRPCRDDTAHSACCAHGYVCLSNGICQATELRQPNRKLARGSCTDKDWRSSDCPAFCIDPDVDNMASGTDMARCEGEDELYWCLNKAQDKASCAKRRNIVLFVGEFMSDSIPKSPTALTTIGVSPSTTASTSFTSITTATTASDSSSTGTDGGPTTSSTQTQSPPSESNLSANRENPGDDKAAIIGGAVGGAAAIVVLGGIGLWWYFRNRTKSLLQAAAVTHAYNSAYKGQSEAPTSTWADDNRQPSQLCDAYPNAVPQELASGHDNARQ